MNYILPLAVLSFGHLMIDLASSLMFFTLINQKYGLAVSLLVMTLCYNGLAFATQPITGLISDKIGQKLTACIGIVATIAGFVIFPVWEFWGVCLACMGNSLYHVAAGGVALKINPGKAIYPGILVAPGALGLLIGTLLARQQSFPYWPVFVVLLAMGFAVAMMQIPVMKTEPVNSAGNKDVRLMLVLILFTVFIRSYTSVLLVFPWKSDMTLLIMLTLALVLGKATGGWLADNLGWKRVGSISLLISAPLLIFGANIPVLAISGTFLFNFTMPITLAAVGLILPRRPAFAFGLTALAIFLGLLPSFSGLKPVLTYPVVSMISIFVSALTLYTGLILMKIKR